MRDDVPHQVVEAQASDQGPPGDGEAGQASGRPSIALTGACLGENADLYVAVDAAASKGLFVDGAGDRDENMDALEYLGVEEEPITSG
jgi:hypothetical protein